MPASLFLTGFTVTPDGPRKGFCVVTAGTYDGRQGVQLPASPLQPIPFKRPRKQPWSHQYQGDGLLIQHWPETPDVFGYTISITATSRKEAALSITGKATSMAGSVASTVGAAPLGALLLATDPLLQAIGQTAGARVLGSLQGSEADASGTQSSWEISRTESSVVFFVKYVVR
ncbi:MAG: hypothetical protein CL927_10710 [Deltaproteobacteria bacterium]|nr:hypothetical protein [Deltaproteobacteria bacterium]